MLLYNYNIARASTGGARRFDERRGPRVSPFPESLSVLP